MADKTKLTGSSTSPPIGFKPWVIVSANITALLFGAAIVWIVFRMGEAVLHLNVLVCLVGALLGWFIGTLASPITKTESTRFLSFGQAISAFVSGYLISKLDRFFEAVLFNKAGEIQQHAWNQAGLFTASLLITSLVVFINRTYYQEARTK